MLGRALVGISGWSYASWRGDFYPKGMPARQELRYVSERLATVEINASFYSLRKPSTYQRWYAETPEGCVLAVKGSRYITHMKQLRDTRVGLANFFASGVLTLQDKLGPFLWQLPANATFDEELLESFFELLPDSAGAAQALAESHSQVVEPVAWLNWDGPLRHALEVRNDSFKDPRAAALLRAHGVALVTADSARRWPTFVEGTAPFRYLRLHGHERLYGGGYSDDLLRSWADKVTKWLWEGCDVFVYFDNDADGRAPYDAQRLQAILGDPSAPA